METESTTSTMDWAQEEVNGNPDTLAVERALGEVRRGRAVDIIHEHQARRVAALETVRGVVMAELMKSSLGKVSLLVSKHRAAALGLDATSGVEIDMPSSSTLFELQATAGLRGPTMPSRLAFTEGTAASDQTIGAALALARRARLVPALISVPRRAPAPHYVIEVNATALAVADDSALILERVTQAHVPLDGAADSKLVLYRDVSGDAEHLALLIGSPSPEEAVLVRLHSSCLTGDLLGSLRCDCGEQLRSSVERIAACGGGVLLYLAQEGRGIGLANKLRAYTLQDTGLDTIDADRHLGFSADERRYQAAAAMLRDLGLTRISLMTNNPAKVAALRAEGIELVERITLNSTINPHNERYLRAKRERSGHLDG